MAVKRTTDGFFGSLGLFLLRLVVAGDMGVRGYQHLTDIQAFTDFLTRAELPSPTYLAWGIGVAEILAAVSLLFGLLTRVAGFGIAALTIAALARVMWGAVNPFQPGVPGFIGELELVLASVGIVLLCLGAADVEHRRQHPCRTAEGQGRPVGSSPSESAGSAPPCDRAWLIVTP